MGSPAKLAPVGGQSRWSGTGLDLDVHRYRSTGGVIHWAVAEPPFRDLSEMVGVGADGLDPNTNADGEWTRRYGLVDPQDAAVIRFAVDDDLQSIQFDTPSGGPHGDQGRLAAGQGGTEEPPRR